MFAQIEGDGKYFLECESLRLHGFAELVSCDNSFNQEVYLKHLTENYIRSRN